MNPIIYDIGKLWVLWQSDMYFLDFQGLEELVTWISLPSTSCVSSYSGLLMLAGSSSRSLVRLYCWIVTLHWWELASLTGISANIFSFTSWRETSIVGCSSENSNVCANCLASIYQYWVPFRSSIEVYQFLGVISNVCMKWWTHSCYGYSANTAKTKVKIFNWVRLS